MAGRIALCVLALAALACGEPERLPAELIGVWRSPNPEFRESYFELREGWVVFGADHYRISMYPIQRIQSSRTDDGTQYSIDYQTEDGAVLPLVLVYSTGQSPRLQVGRRKDLWVPESQASWLAKEES
jgi:hypothetical protein